MSDFIIYYCASCALCTIPSLLGSTHVTSGSCYIAAATSAPFPPLVLLRCRQHKRRCQQFVLYDIAAATVTGLDR